MGKKKHIRILKLEVERLRKIVLDREVVIDKLLSDTITDGEKNVIKLDRHFAKATAAEFDKYLLSGKTPDYSTVSKVCDFYDTIKRNQNNLPNISEGFNDLPLDEVKVYHRPTNSETVAFQKQGRVYRHTEEGDKVFGELAGKPITHHKVPQDDCVPKIVTAEFNVEMPNGYKCDYQCLFDHMHNEHGLILTLSEMHEIIRECQKVLDLINNKEEHNPEGMVTIQAPVGSFIVPPTDNKIVNEHLSVIQEELQTEIDKKERLRNCEYLIVIKEKDDLPPIGSIFKNQGNCFVFNSKDHFRSIPLYLMFNYWKENIVRFLSPSEEGNRDYVEFNINHGDKFVKEVEYNGDGVIKTKITYPDADGAPKTMVDIHDDINFMETIVKMPGCTLSDKEEIERLRKENEEF